MIPKRITPFSWGDGRPATTLLNVGRRGFDRDQLMKLAAADVFVFNPDVKPEHGFAFVHVITTGSMEKYGCFFAGQEVLTAEGPRPIECLEKGDSVWTHRNRFRPVTKTFVRDYQGPVQQLFVNCLPDPVVSTTNHSFLVLRAAKFHKHKMDYWHRTHDRVRLLQELSAEKPEWTRADQIKADDYLYVPCGSPAQLVSQLPIEYAYLFGYYLAEACLCDRLDRGPRHPGSMVFVFEREKDAACIETLRQIVEKAGHAFTPCNMPNCQKTVRIQVSWREMAETLRQYMGRGAREKFLHPALFGQSVEWRKTFIAAYLDGDGCLSNSKQVKHSNVIMYSTASRRLAYDMFRMLASVGIHSSMSHCTNRAGQATYSRQDTVIYAGSISRFEASQLEGYTKRLRIERVERAGEPQQKSLILSTGYVLARVRKVAQSAVVAVPVYNCAVQDDESYVVDVVGHNSNNNADGFNEEACPYTGDSGRISQLGGGLKKYHSTFSKYGAVYFNHFNGKKGGTPQGTIVAETYNPTMHRGELVLKLPLSKWAADIAALEQGNPFFVSMGCGVPYDICSVCLHQAPDRSSYCEHLKYAMNTLLPSGRLVFAINDQPHFHDISKVSAPADRIAFSLRKVAAEGAGIFAPLAEPDLWVPLPVINAIGSRKEASRAVLLDKLAELEKRIQVQGLAPAEKDLSEAFGRECEPDQVSKMMKIPLGELMASTQRANVMLPPKTLILVVLRRPAADIPGLADLPVALRSVFGDLQERGDLLHELTNDGSYAPGFSCPAQSTSEMVNGMKRDLSMDDEPVRQRVIRITVSGGRSGDHDKHAGNKPSAEATVLAREYAKYQLSYLAGRPHTEADLLKVAVHNQSW